MKYGFRVCVCCLMLGLVPYRGTAATYQGTFSESSGNTHEIGTFHFRTGKTGFVRVSTENTTKTVNVDAVFFTRVADGHVDTVDNADTEGFFLFGHWVPSTWRDIYVGDGYLSDYGMGKGMKYAVFMPDIGVEGDYTVTVHHAAHSSVFDPAVPVTVRYDISDTAYALTVANGSGDGYFPYMKSIVVSADAPPAGQVFDHWISDNGGHFAIPSAPVTEYVMADTAVTVTAVYKEETYIRESVRDIPLIASVDAVVVNANMGGVAAAVALANAGHSVLVTNGTSSLPYEMSAKSRFWLGPDEIPQPGAGQDIFGTRTTGTDGYAFYQPGALKKNLEQYLKDAGVDFLYYTQPVGVLEDGAGNTAGLVVANRSGRQAVAAKVIIDNTPMAGVARMAGARMTGWTVDSVTASHTILFGGGSDDEGTFVCRYGDQWTPDAGDVREYALNVPMRTGTWRDRCQAEMLLRTVFFKPDAAWRAHHLHMVEPNHIVARAAETAWNGIDGLDLGVCRPESLSRIYVLSSACAVSRDGAEELVRPLNLIGLGERIGAEIADAFDTMGTAGILNIPVGSGNVPLAGYDIAEALSGHRPFQDYSFITQAENDVPVWGSEYDVIVVGGGTAGAPAAISAARAGARVLLVEALGSLGGTGTNGIGTYVHLGYQHGFAMEFGKDEIYTGRSSWHAVEKQQWLYNELQRAGGEVWFNTLGVGVVKAGNRVCGVVVATPMGRAVVMGKKIIDTTGDGDVCAWAGADVTYVNNGDFLLMRSCHSGNDAEASRTQQNEYTNIFTDPSSAWSMTHFFAFSRQYGVHADQFDFYPHANTRESRRIVGDAVVRSLDQMVGRTYHDMVVVGAGMAADINGYRNSPNAYAGIYNYGDVNIENYYPLRALLPKGLTGIMVAGRCHSFTHEGIGLTRNQADCNNEGYAAGHIAARAALQDIAVRDIDLGPVREHLCGIGNMEQDHIDTKCVDTPEPTDQFLEVAAADPDSMNLAWLLYAGSRSVPFLHTSFSAEPTLQKARALCFLGDTAGVAYLAGWLDSTALGTPDAFGTFDVSEIDGAIWALGLAGDERAVPVLADKLGECGTSADDFSRIRSLTMALGSIGSAQGASALNAFLGRSGVSGHHKTVTDDNSDIENNVVNAVIELHAAAALYRCGDVGGAAENVLNNYLNDWRTSYARFAAHVLQVDTTATAVELTGFNAALTDSGIALTWTTSGERMNMGWNIYRKAEGEPAFSKINAGMIPGNGTTAQPSSYGFLDTVSVTQTTTMQYYLEQVDSSGGTTNSYIVSLDITVSGITPPALSTGSRMEILRNPFVISRGRPDAVLNNVSIFDLEGRPVSLRAVRCSGPYLMKTGNTVSKVIVLVK